MDCEKLKAALYAYLDGELDVKDTIEIEQHIAACPMCEALVRYEERFRKVIRGVLKGEPAPPSLRGRIAAGLDACQRRRCKWMPRLSWVNPRLVAAATAAAVVVIAILSLLPDGGAARPAEARELADDAINAHLKYMNKELPMFPCHDITELVSLFRNELEFALSSPPIDGEPVGGRVYPLKGISAAHLIYRCRSSAEKDMSVFAFDADRIKMPEHEIRTVGNRRYVSCSHRGLTAVTWTENGVAYITVSDMSRDYLMAHLFAPSREPATAPRNDMFEHVSSTMVGP